MSFSTRLQLILCSMKVVSLRVDEFRNVGLHDPDPYLEFRSESGNKGRIQRIDAFQPSRTETTDRIVE